MVRRRLHLAAIAAALVLVGHTKAEAQLGALLSPGRLTTPHASLEGIANCEKCHERGQRITPQKCLACHKPIADRIVRRAGVHRDVKGDCVACHVEHTGPEGELRPFDQRAFDHARVTGFALDGKHATVARQCAACHKTRSFLTASASCQSCHTDVHKGTLGSACSSCHTTTVAFKDVTSGGRFDHARTAFPLTGAHNSVSCVSCHANGQFKGVSFASCVSCHKSPHQPSFGTTCATCHTTERWRTTKVDHSRTAFPLRGRHASVACVSCHKQSAMDVKPRSDTCAACHVDVHRGAFKQDCKSCHSENGFSNAPFDHTRTAFPLIGKHATLACAACHKPTAVATTRTAARVTDFRGLKISCVSCHTDVHQGELGATCESCHSPASFTVSGYKHARFPDFFAGQHASVTCGQCHVAPDRPPAPAARPAVLNVRFKLSTTSCASCHKDVHLGQLGRECQSCHSIQVAKFGLADFSHARTMFPLTGKHATVACSACHQPVTGIFPAGTGTAVRLKGVAVECRACHQDPHKGQLEQECQSCHVTDTFKVSDFKHRNPKLAGFFVGRHVAAACASCHKQGLGRVDARCTTCHRDEHNGALPDCQRCHRP